MVCYYYLHPFFQGIELFLNEFKIEFKIELKTLPYYYSKMEQKIKQKLADYTLEFKKNVQAWLTEHNAEIVSNKTIKTNSFLEHIYDFPTLELSKIDFQKRTRTKNNIPNYERCCALRLNGERCTRKKRDGIEYCGTHLKGVPYGVIEEKPSQESKRLDIWLEEINGIHQYIDEDGNVYATEDITHSVKSPRIISKWTKTNGEYFIHLT